MNDFTTELVKTLLKVKDIIKFFRQLVESAVNQLLLYELIEFLDYNKYNHKDSI